MCSDGYGYQEGETPTATPGGGTVPDQPAVPEAPVPAPGPVPAPKKRRIWPWLLGCGAVLFGCIVITLVVLYFIGADANDSGTSGGEPAEATYVAPDPDALIGTTEWGLVPGDQLFVLLVEGADQSVAEAAATAVDGEIIGDFELIGLYEIGIQPTDEDGLLAALDAAAAVDGVERAFSDALVVPQETVTGTRCTPTSEDVYAQGENGRPYDMIGVERAWDLIAASGLELKPVRVGVVDDGLYEESGELDGTVNWATTGHLEDDYLSEPKYMVDPNDPTKKTPKPNYSHGTAVASIIAANADDGGMTGVASVLGDGLTVEMANIYRSDYSQLTTVAPDVSDPTQLTYSAATYSVGPLMDMYRQVNNGAKVISCSWGTSLDPQTGKYQAHPAVNAAYKRFYEKMLADHPDVTFVCSAGNDGIAPNGSGRIPGGFDLPNIITVGNLENDGTRRQSSNTSSADYEVTLAAPGHGVVSGIGADGTVANTNGGTSFATPQVTATIALMRAVDPNLTAAEIKEILRDTARAEVEDGAGGTTQIESGLGAGALATDRAVEAVITKMRGGKALTEAEITAATEITLTASSDDGTTWNVVAKIPSVRRGGADVTIVIDGAANLSGDEVQRLLQDGSVQWTVTTEQDASPIAHVRRMDTRACWRATLGSTLAGTYVGTFPVVFGGYGEIQVPYTVTIESDGTFAGTWHYSGDPGIPGIANYMTDAQFGGTLVGTHAEASGTSSATVTGDVGGSIDASSPFTFSADVEQDGSALVGTLVSSGGSFEINAVRQE